jgi:mRNA-degrading endonuclease RelE of RelBE toxin-antitoxin system
MWTVLEATEVKKELRRCPQQILEKYEAWKNLVRMGGPQMLLQLRGLRDEALHGNLNGYRSSRLNLLRRVVYLVQKVEVTVVVVQISPHEY